jgi:RNA polymerase sigma factor (sigma-70 family)
VSFRALPDHELDRLADRALIGYLRAARAAGEDGAARRALQLLVFGHWDLVEARVAMRVPSEAVQDVTADVVVRAIASAFAGESAGELQAWLTTILRRTVADYYRARGRTPVVDRSASRGVDEQGLVEATALVEQALGELRADHRRIVELVVFADRPAAEACARVGGVTEANAYQIARRFRARLRALLEDPDDG